VTGRGGFNFGLEFPVALERINPRAVTLKIENATRTPNKDFKHGTSCKIFVTDIAIFTNLKTTRLWDDFPPFL